MHLKLQQKTQTPEQSTINCLRVLANWCQENGKEKYPENYIPTELDKLLLEQFFVSVCKQDGTDYQTGSSKVMQTALDCYLREKGCSFSILKEFQVFQLSKSFILT